MKRQLASTLVAVGLLSATGCDPSRVRTPAPDGTSTLTTMDHVSTICEIRTKSELLATSPPSDRAAEIELRYNDTYAKGDAYLSSLSLAVMNRSENDPGLVRARDRLVRSLDDLQKARTDTAAASAFDWQSFVVKATLEAVKFGIDLRKERRNTFASEIKRTCAWRSFGAINSPAQTDAAP